jgi:hypothetical protein
MQIPPRRSAVETLKEGLTLVATVALVQGFRCGHSIGPEYSPATIEAPGSAGITVEVLRAGSFRVALVAADPDDRRWDAVEEIVKEIVNAADPDLEELNKCEMTGHDRGVYTSLRSDWLTYYRFLKQSVQDSAHERMEAATRLEALMVEAGLARRKAAHLMGKLLKEQHFEA